MMLECNLKLAGCFCLQMPEKALINLRMAQDFVESLASVGWSEPANNDFLSHDIQCVLYLVLYGDNPFNMEESL